MAGIEVQLTRVARAEPDDAFRLAALELARNREAGGSGEQGFLERFADAWLAERDRYPSWLASRLDGNPVGALTLTLVPGLPRPGRVVRPWGSVSTLYVRAEARRQGVGSRLVEEAVAWARAHDVPRLVATPVPGAAACYRRAGFTAADAETVRWAPARR